MPDKARYATTHWLRFSEVTSPDQLVLSGRPDGARSWNIGPSGPVGPNGYRLPATVWCGVGLFTDRETATAAFRQHDRFMPFESASESWHQLVVPYRHRGESNHLDRENPGEIFEVASEDPGGTLMVITTAGYRLGPDLKVERLIDFRRKVDLVDDWLQQAGGCLASRPFTPHIVGTDGFTMSVWRDEESMLNASYRAGVHREQMERHKAESMFDRSSFTRCRILESSGSWNGRNPLEGMPG